MRQSWAGTSGPSALPEARSPSPDLPSESPLNKAAAAVLGALLAVAVTACGATSSDKGHKPALSKDELAAVAGLEKAFTSSTSGALTTKEAHCVATDFVSSVGVAKLRAAKLITASGEVNTTGSPTFDARTSGKFADALLGCVDYQKRLAEQTAKSDTTIDAAKYEACLDTSLPDSLVKKMLVASQTRAKDATTIGEQAKKAMTDCQADAKK